MAAEMQTERLSRVSDRATYRRSPDVTVTENTDSHTGETTYFLKSIDSGELFLFGEKEYGLLCTIEVDSTYQAVKKSFSARCGITISQADFEAFVQNLVTSGILESVDGVAENAGAELDDEAGAPQETASVQVVDPAATYSSSSFAARGASPARPNQSVRIPFRIKLFNPTAFFRGLGFVFRPIWYLLWILLPLVLFAGLGLFHRQSEFVADFSAVVVKLPMVATFLLGLSFINILGRVVQGTVIVRLGGEIKHSGITFMLGFLPRYYIDRSSLTSMPRRAQLWAYASPILAWFTLFAVGTILWLVHRGTGTLLPEVSLIVGQMGLWAAALVAIPLIPADGYRWLSAYLEQPQLRDRALRLLGMRLRGRPAPESMTVREKWGLLFFGIGTALCVSALLSCVFLFMGINLEKQYQGTGVSIFLALFTTSVVWMLAMKASMAYFRRAGRRSEGMPAALPEKVAAQERLASVVSLRPDHAPAFEIERADFRHGSASKVSPRRLSRAHLVWAALAAGLIAVAFLPYGYEAGGDFQILPNERYEIRSRVDGELVEIRVDEGQVVEPGQVIAVVSDWKQKRDLAVAMADLDKAKANLQTLEDSPKPEEVEFAKSQVAIAEATIPYARTEAERATQLIKSGTISAKKYEAALTEYDLARSRLTSSKANLDLVKAGPLPSEIEAARAEVRRLIEEVQFRKDELERTRLRATKAGRIVTPNLRFLKGKYLKEGDLFAEIEDHSVARAEVATPESDIGFVTTGAVVRLKAWASSDDERVGTVVSIAPLAEKLDYGRVVRVSTDIPNADGFFRPGMTGYGKIEGAEMPVWRAYTRMFMRFFQIEVWSWIP